MIEIERISTKRDASNSWPRAKPTTPKPIRARGAPEQIPRSMQSPRPRKHRLVRPSQSSFGAQLTTAVDTNSRNKQTLRSLREVLHSPSDHSRSQQSPTHSPRASHTRKASPNSEYQASNGINSAVRLSMLRSSPSVRTQRRGPRAWVQAQHLPPFYSFSALQ